jgi:hypothetical protein
VAEEVITQDTARRLDVLEMPGILQHHRAEASVSQALQTGVAVISEGVPRSIAAADPF